MSNLEVLARPGLQLSRAAQETIFDPSTTKPSNGIYMKTKASHSREIMK